MPSLDVQQSETIQFRFLCRFRQHKHPFRKHLYLQNYLFPFFFHFDAAPESTVYNQIFP